jgi:hypothetical protein
MQQILGATVNILGAMPTWCTGFTQDWAYHKNRSVNVKIDVYISVRELVDNIPNKESVVLQNLRKKL